MRHSKLFAVLGLIAALIGVVSGYFQYNIESISLFLYDQRRYFRYLGATSIVVYALSLTQRSWERYCIQVIMLSHLGILSYFFLVISLGFDQYLSSLLIICSVILLLGTLLNARRRIAIIVPMSVTIFIGTVIFILPTYDTIPTSEQFYDVFGIQFHLVIKDIPMTLRDISAGITISSSANPEQQLNIRVQEDSPQMRTYTIRKPTTIQFDASEPLYNTFGFIQFYDGAIVPLPAQASLTIAYTQTGYITILDGIAAQENTEDAAAFIAYESSILSGTYQDQRKQYFINAVGGSWTQYLYVDVVVSYMLNYLAQNFPDKYAKNYQNYITFKSMLGEEVSPQSRFQEQEQSLNSIWNVVLPGLKQSTLFGRFFD